MIVSSYSDLADGHRGKGVYDSAGNFQKDQTFTVVRQATPAEWNAGKGQMPFHQLQDFRAGRLKFYEIAVDLKA